MNDAVRDLVRERAGDACEYCRLAQTDQPWARFHIEHIRPRQHQGTDDLVNLCLACGHCNRFKGPNVASIDPVTGELTPLFHRGRIGGKIISRRLSIAFWGFLRLVA